MKWRLTRKQRKFARDAALVCSRLLSIQASCRERFNLFSVTSHISNALQSYIYTKIMRAHLFFCRLHQPYPSIPILFLFHSIKGGLNLSRIAQNNIIEDYYWSLLFENLLSNALLEKFEDKFYLRGKYFFSHPLLFHDIPSTGDSSTGKRFLSSNLPWRKPARYRPAAGILFFPASICREGKIRPDFHSPDHRSAWKPEWKPFFPLSLVNSSHEGMRYRKGRVVRQFPPSRHSHFSWFLYYSMLLSLLVQGFVDEQCTPSSGGKGKPMTIFHEKTREIEILKSSPSQSSLLVRTWI